MDLYGHFGPLRGHNPIFFKTLFYSKIISLSIQMGSGRIIFYFNPLNGHYLYPQFFRNTIFQHKMSYYAFYLNKFLFIPFNLWPCLFYTDSKWPLNELGFSGLKEWIICNSFKPFLKNAFFFQNCTWWPLTLKKSMFHPSDWWKLLVYWT